MADFVIYILKSGMVLTIYYLLYVLLLRKETFYHFNRIYILGALVISIVVPVLDIQLSKPAASLENNFVYVEDAFFGFSQTVEMMQIKAVDNVNSFPIIVYLLMVGVFLATSRMALQLYGIYKNVKKNEVKKHGKYRYVLIDQYHSTHSFFNYIFVQKSEFKKKQMKEVLLHEQMHANHKHSIDLLLIGFLSILQWFNPFIYLFKRALVETHEFQADQAVISQGIDRSQYQQLLLEHARSVVMTGLTSSFNQSIIKNRLKMMNKIKSSRRMIIKYLMVFPIVFFVGIFFAISQAKIEDSIVEVINITKSGDAIIGTSDFAIIDLPEDDRISLSAKDFIDLPDVVRMKNAKLETSDKSLSVNADNILINRKERKLYAFTDDYIPSILPVEGENVRKTSGFGMRMHPILKEKRMHNGIDFSAKEGTAIFASANGTVRSTEHSDSYGNRVIIDHGNGYSSSYSQMQKYIVKASQSVKKGDVIGYVGSSGLSTAPHLHYEIMKDGEYVDPKDYLGLDNE